MGLTLRLKWYPGGDVESAGNLWVESLCYALEQGRGILE